ncbi:MAG: TIGR02270 family protein [Thiocapsa sp.]|uniref:TIGR02270 family protein n=1 Tax=Thiocapsa sp. TaxID=2024551 RepID=UPI001BCA7A2E|nr:TIGR02270 family protein [Thiocapsa sp.]QVL49154.1 MAG: TIGR02270 family protein [Thiocapsa sp.]
MRGGARDAGAGEVFAAAVSAIGSKDKGRIDRLFALAETLADARRGLISAFGWVSAQDLQGIVAELLASEEPIRREVGIAACIMHRLDPGATLAHAIENPDPRLRARALRAAGEAGRRDLVYVCLGGLQDADPCARFWAAVSSLLLGNRDRSSDVLADLADKPGPFRAPALELWLKAVDLPSGHRLLQSMANDPANQRLLIRGAGVAGQMHYIPWLIRLMSDDVTARLAGESFSTITGLDLAWLDFERNPPGDFEPGPTDDPDDPNVDLDPDDSLPWPDQAKIQAWWGGTPTGSASTRAHAISWASRLALNIAGVCSARATSASGAPSPSICACCLRARRSSRSPRRPGAKPAGSRPARTAVLKFREH